MNPKMPTLLELQRAMQKSLLQGADEDIAGYVIANGLERRARLGIYRNTCASALASALHLSFPTIEHLVGVEFFDGVARLFAAGAPPRSASLDEYGADFAEFLAHFPQASALPYLADVARLEWQINVALHAADAVPLDIGRLAVLTETALAQVRLEPHPAVRLLRCEFPADAIWRAVLERDEPAMAAIDLADGPVWLLVQRTPGGIEVTRLAEREWRLTAALLSRRPLQQALEEAPCDNVHALLAAQLARGYFADAGVAPATVAG